MQIPQLGNKEDVIATVGGNANIIALLKLIASLLNDSENTTDGIEALLTSANALLTTINTATSSGIVTNASLDTSINNVEAYTQNASGHSLLVVTSNATPITTATSTEVVAAPGSSKHLRIYRLHAINQGSTSTLVSWKPGSGSEYLHAYLPQGGIASPSLPLSYWRLPSNTAMNLVTSAAGSVHWTVFYLICAD